MEIMTHDIHFNYNILVFDKVMESSETTHYSTRVKIWWCTYCSIV